MPRQREEIVALMSGLVGYKLTVLLVPLMRRWHRRYSHGRVSAARRTTVSDAINALQVGTPLSLSWSDLQWRSVVYFRGESVIYEREPSFSMGVVVCTSGSLIVRRGLTEEVLDAPVILGVTECITDEPSDAHVVAKTPVEAYIAPYREIQRLAYIDGTPEALRDAVRLRTASVHRSFSLTPRFVAQSWLLSACGASLVEFLATRSRLTVAPPGVRIAERRRVSRGVAFVRRGRCRVAFHGGREEPREGLVVLGERSVAFGDRCDVDVVAVTVCDVWMVPASEIDALKTFDLRAKAALRDTGRAMATAWLRDARREGAMVALQALFREAIGQLPYLANVEPSVVEEIAPLLLQRAEPCFFEKHATVASMSSWCNYLLILSKGVATRQTLKLDGVWQATFRRGHCVGWECVIQHRWPSTICAVTMVEAWSVPREAVVDALSRHGLLAKAERMVGDSLDEQARALDILHVTRSLRSNAAPPPPTPPREGGSSGRRIRTYYVTAAYAPEPPAPPPAPSDARDVAWLAEFDVDPRSCDVSGGRCASRGLLWGSNDDIERRLAREKGTTTAPSQAPPTIEEETEDEEAEFTIASSESAPEADLVEVHIRPFTYMVVEVAEWLGEVAPSLVVLLDRKCALFGHLYGSTPKPYTTHRCPRTEIVHRLPHAPNSSTAKVWQEGQMKYRPLHPHSYAPILPRCRTDRPPPIVRPPVNVPDDLIERILRDHVDDLSTVPDALDDERPHRMRRLLSQH